MLYTYNKNTYEHTHIYTDEAKGMKDNLNSFCLLVN